MNNGIRQRKPLQNIQYTHMDISFKKSNTYTKIAVVYQAEFDKDIQL